MNGIRVGRLGSVCAAVVLAATAAMADPPAARERVDGIGGFFFLAKSPKVLAQWYSDHLGVSLTPTAYNQKPWVQAAGPTAFQPFPAKSNFFGRAGQQFELNFRVRNLDAMVKQLRQDGIKVDRDPKVYPNGLFASLNDPEGNPIQLWQPEENEHR